MWTLESTEGMGSVSGMASQPELLPTQPTLPKSVRVLKPALLRHLLSTEHTREEAKALEPLAYEKYNKGNWVQQLGNCAEAAGTGSSGHGGLSPPRAR